MACGCACCNKFCEKLTHTVISIIGLTLSCMEFILASVYNFQFIGFGLSILGIVTSGLYLWFNVKKEGAETNNMQISESTKVLMEQSMRMENKKDTKTRRILWILYVIAIIFLGVIAFARLVSLLRRIEWRNDLDG